MEELKNDKTRRIDHAQFGESFRPFAQLLNRANLRGESIIVAKKNTGRFFRSRLRDKLFKRLAATNCFHSRFNNNALNYLLRSKLVSTKQWVPAEGMGLYESSIFLIPTHSSRHSSHRKSRVDATREGGRKKIAHRK